MIINGPAFKQVREDLLMTKFTLAKASGVSPNVIYGIELSRRTSPKLLMKVLDALNLTPEQAYVKKMIEHN
ncbi:MAG: helix-turn-helix domain-containing protein [Deltaproteobacteria bacterium]|jgi:DNA-binding XRE family transcriptional regulator|nr:helix-turn-helix domain-containing protein [Deltaproteobacteria bacterium]